MSHTYGSQVFGQAYDVVVPVMMAVALIYFGVRSRGMTPHERAKMPLIIGNWKACFFFAAIATLLAVAKCLHS
jgi:hypothetical protein